MKKITKEEVLKALSYVNDPDLNKDLVSLNMIKDIEIGDNKVSFSVVLTTPACPMKDSIQMACVNAIHHFIGKDVEVDVNMTSNVTTQRGGDENILPGVKNIIAVSSGKGGVGKSTVSVNLALALAQNNAKVGLIDADIYGPSIPTMLGLVGERPAVKEINGKPIMTPIEKYGIKVLSLGNLVDDQQAVVWRGPMASSALRQLFTDSEWGDLDYLVVDLPPGTGDIHLTLVQMFPVTGAVIVTTPQEVALADVKKSIGMFKMPAINTPVIGIVENMSYFTPPELPDKKYYLFGKEGGKKLAQDYGLPLLGELPIVEAIRDGGDNGKPLALDKENPVTKAFNQLAQAVAQQIAVINSKQHSTEKEPIINN